MLQIVELMKSVHTLKGDKLSDKEVKNEATYNQKLAQNASDILAELKPRKYDLANIAELMFHRIHYSYVVL